MSQLIIVVCKARSNRIATKLSFAVTHGFDLPKSLQQLNLRLKDKLDNERIRGIAGARSDVVLIVPYMSTIDNGDKDFCKQTLLRMREQYPGNSDAYHIPF